MEQAERKSHIQDNKQARHNNNNNNNANNNTKRTMSTVATLRRANIQSDRLHQSTNAVFIGWIVLRAAQLTVLKH